MCNKELCRAIANLVEEDNYNTDDWYEISGNVMTLLLEDESQ